MAEKKLVVRVEGPRWQSPDGGYVQREVERAGMAFRSAICSNDAETIAACKDADGILSGGPAFTKEVIDQLTKCKIIVQCSVGFDRLDVDAATAAGIMVANLAQFCVLEVRNQMMALMLGVNRKLLLGDKMVRAGGWSPGGLAPIETLYGQTLGLIAFGTIPRLITPLAQAFGMNVITHDPFVDVAVAAEYKVAFVSLEELLRSADFVSNHIPLGPRTRHFLKEEHFRMMKKTAYFINTARGAVADEAALYKALKEGWIAGAGLDVLEKEPPDKDNPIFQLENVILAPHAAGQSTAVPFRRWQHATQECIRVLGGDWPQWFVNPQVKTSVRR
jgi:D-3-phosphoglycerate dehydrogenase